MSYPPTPPPIPQAPIPVQPLGYVPPPTYARPGILTAVAVISIIVGSLGLIFSGGSALYGFGMAVASGVSRTTARTATVVTPLPPVVGQSASSEDGNEEDGMPEAGRKVVVDALASIRPLPDVRRKHLDALLALGGKKILPLSGDALTAQAVRANVTDAGRFPSGSGKASAGSDYFAVALGRIEIDDRHAVFYPVGAGEVLRASGDSDDAVAEHGEEAESTDDTAAVHSGAPSPSPATFGAPLTDSQVQQVIAAIEARTGRKLSTAQSNALKAQLKSQGQMIFMPAPGGSPVTTQITNTTWSNGTFVLVTGTGSVTLSSNGSIFVSGGFTSGATSFPNVTTEAVLVLICAGLSFLLAILVLVAGIATTRNSPRARKLHLVYAYLKLPVGIADMLAGAWLWHSILNGLPTSGVTPTWSVAAIFSIPALLGLVYPVALLIVMHIRTVKAYYSPVVDH